jgi:type II secretory ATPase GspE/PulE/Tfp pilus assembly ATPase PilB-like protein
MKTHNGNNDVSGHIANGLSENDSEPAPTVRLCNAIIVHAINAGASDVEFVPTREHTQVRVLVNGVWEEQTNVPAHVATNVMNRYKVMAQVNYYVKSPPVAHISVRHEEKAYDLAVAFTSTRHGDHARFCITSVQ